MGGTYDPELYDLAPPGSFRGDTDLYPVDIRRLLERSGFGAILISGGFDGRPFAHDTDELVVEATRL
jgi:hypothetical protein